jgi:hypothetical protein
MTSRFSSQAGKLQHGGSVVFVQRFNAGSGRCSWKFVAAKQRGNVNRRWIQEGDIVDRIAGWVMGQLIGGSETPVPT